ncbi:acetyl-CoA synthetase-like protein [Byssothecium circinans]|uniref:Acetyl-CoA synthetase-like protein n=1 Tax=Byssothecium circinans TaxID=147558 RepID=A0A6A5UA30_9PLEO|nr:acetyl-CoA synthetase-like protein [Byssothecium circinans]
MIHQIKQLLSPGLSPLNKLVMAGVLDSAHVAGMFINNFLCLALGFTNVIVPGTNTPLLLETLVTQRVNLLFTVPPILSRLTLEPGYTKADLRHLKYVVTGAAPASPALQMATSKPMTSNAYCQQGWGMTELTFLATMPEPGILCDEGGQEVRANMQGEIYVSGPTVCRGYYSVPDNSQNVGALPEWFRTGDLGYFDEKGYMYINGRNKDLIKYNGAQVSPLELEDVIREHPRVADVAVVGTQLEDGNELPTAFIIPKETPSAGNLEILARDIFRFTENRVSPYKRPRGGVHLVDAIPKNQMGKTLRKDLREAATKDIVGSHSNFPMVSAGGFGSPRIIEMIVDLPAPLGPRRSKTSHDRMPRVTFSTATFLPENLEPA